MPPPLGRESVTCLFSVYHTSSVALTTPRNADPRPVPPPFCFCTSIYSPSAISHTSYQLPTSPDGLYHWIKLSTAGLKGLLIFLFLHLLILRPCFCLLFSSLCPSFVCKTYWMSPFRFLTAKFLVIMFSHCSWKNVLVALCCLQKSVKLKQYVWPKRQERR